MSNVKFSGIMPAVVTPVNEDGTLREESLRKILRWHLACGVDGFYVGGGTGEGPVLQLETRMKLAEVVADEVSGKGKVICHVGAIDLISARKLARHAREVGVDAISSVPPFFFGYGEKEITQYYTALAEESQLPLLMYASPLAGTKITCEMVDRLMDVPGMIGLKWTSYDYYEMNRIKNLREGDINVINGPDETLLCGLVMGADGGIGATYNVMPKLFVNIYRYFKEGNLEAARREQQKANRVIELLIQWNVFAGVKDILDMLGYECGAPTYPMKQFTDEERKAFRAELERLQFERDYL